jgi:hypothetical protein
VFPNFDELIFPILDMQGEFQIQVDILQQGHYNASSSTESIALASSFNSESLPNKEDYLGSYNHQLEYPLGIFSDLEILYPNSMHLGRHIDWNKAFAVIIAISGYGELRFSSPYFGQ